VDALGETDLEHPLLEGGRHLFRVDPSRERQGAGELPGPPLRTVVGIPWRGVGVRAPYPTQVKHPRLHGQLDVRPVDPREVDPQDDLALPVDQVQAR
jgi:hypothetical protein